MGLCSAIMVLPTTPLIPGRAMELVALPAVTAAGAARVPAPKNAEVSVS
jgi:hypothetical protein